MLIRFVLACHSNSES